MIAQDYLNVIKKSMLLIIVVAVLVTALALVVSAMKRESFNVSVSLGVNVLDKQETQDYKFSRYYSVQASEKFSETVASWFLSPEIVRDILEKSSIDTSSMSFWKLSKYFNAEPLAAQNVELRFNVNDKAKANQIIDAIRVITDEKLTEINKDQEANFAIFIKEPVVVPKNYPLGLVGGISAVVGLLLGAALSFLFHFAKKN